MEDELDIVHDAAVRASANVPVRRRRRQASTQPPLKTFATVPQYLRDNEYILNHYRAEYSVGQGLKSLFWVHNETGNVWTHLLGFLLFLGLTVYLITNTPAALTAPLAFGRDQLITLQTGLHDSLQLVRQNLNSLQGHLHENFYSVQSHVQQNLLTLQNTLHSKVHALQDSVQSSVQALQGGVTHLQDNLQHTASSLTHNIKDGVTFNLGAIQDSLHAVRTQLEGQLHSALGTVLQLRATRWPVYVYMVGAMVCLLVSSVCHLFACCSRHAAKWMWRLDYSGIAVLIVTSFFPPVYYGFMCTPFWRNFYLAITSAMGAATIVVSLSPMFQTPRYRVFRASLFTGLGVWGVVPLVHAWYMNFASPQFFKAMLYDLLMGVCYLGGAAIYAARIPERWKPGAFDVVFHSHQIFHVAVVVAAIAHFYAVMVLLEWRDAAGACPADASPDGLMAHVLAELQHLAHELGAVEQVWESLKHQLQHHAAPSA